MRALLAITVSLFFTAQIFAQSTGFNGLNTNLGNLWQVSDAETRSISPENFTGEKGKAGMETLENGTASRAARDLGQGWKVNPYIHIKAGETFTLAEIEGSGAIQHIWMTPTGTRRFSIIRIYWDDETEPSVECPVGDFFGTAKGIKYINSLAVCVNPGSGFNSYWQMPFRKKCKITMENIDEEDMRLYYQIDYTLTEVPDDAAYFHAQFRRTNPLPYKDVYTIVDGLKGKGQYVGTYMFWQPNNNDWWGEGEIKFYMDGDKEFPTICGTGTEDYFCGSYNFGGWDPDAGKPGKYKEYSTAYTGFQYFEPSQYSNIRFGLYRWHIVDPVRFDKDLKITIQALGWRSGGRYLPLQDDISSVAFWYQLEPHARFPPLPDKDYLEIQ
ncbi:MAG: glycoside hydrolase family 172 protein [Bacteroidota bacterium]